MNSSLVLLLLASTCFNLSSCSYDNVKLVSNGYEGIVIAINPNVPENPNIIESLKVSFFFCSKTKVFNKDSL